jgi:uncharacterized beta-barrel protein YwiB (DUF1934 family)
MEKDVIISVRGMQKYDGAEEDTIELVTEGQLSDRGEEGLTLSYQESELTGMEGTLTSFQVEKNGRVTLMRSGGINSQMVFEEGIAHDSLYQMAFGTLMLTVKASFVYYDIVPDGGTIDLSYQINIENTEAGVIDYHLDIRAK